MIFATAPLTPRKGVSGCKNVQARLFYVSHVRQVEQSGEFGFAKRHASCNGGLFPRLPLAGLLPQSHERAGGASELHKPRQQTGCAFNSWFVGVVCAEAIKQTCAAHRCAVPTRISVQMHGLRQYPDNIRISPTVKMISNATLTQNVKRENASILR
jgi:hypothetical protein